MVLSFLSNVGACFAVALAVTIRADHPLVAIGIAFFAGTAIALVSRFNVTVKRDADG